MNKKFLTVLNGVILVLLSLTACVIFVSCGEKHVHEWSEWEPYIDSTCFVQGQERSVCSCGKVKYHELPVVHDFELKEKDISTRENVFVCKKCGSESREEMTVEELGLPIVTMTGSMDGISRENRVTLDVKYEGFDRSFEAKGSIKIQGTTSSVYPKKNYSIKFKDEDGEKLKVTVLDEWGSHSKYCLKANYTDYTQARNVVSAKLFGQIAKTRNKNDVPSTLPNGGAIDGFPVAVYFNGEFLGLYTFNTPKDEYIAGIKDNEPAQAMLFANDYTAQTQLAEPITDISESGFEFEYCYESAEAGQDWAIESFNNMINFINSNDGDAFRNGISGYVDVERAIDEMLFVYAIGGADNTSKNMLWVTYDGVVWVPSPYDLDATFGLSWDGTKYLESGIVVPGYAYNMLWDKLNKYFPEEVSARWAELRNGPLSLDNINSLFSDFLSLIPDGIRAEEKALWTEVPMQEENGYEQITGYASSNIYLLDVYYGLQ